VKLFYDSLPIVLFFILYYLFDIFAATIGAMVATSLQVGLIILKGQKPETAQWITLVTILTLGSATLFFKNEMFIKWKPTAVYWTLSLAFLASQFIGKKSLIKRMLDKTISLPAPIWVILNTSWSTFFLLMGVLNLFIVYHFETRVWVNFKLFGSLGLTFLFVLLQGIFLARYLPAVNEANTNTAQANNSASNTSTDPS